MLQLQKTWTSWVFLYCTSDRPPEIRTIPGNHCGPVTLRYSNDLLFPTFSHCSMQPVKICVLGPPAVGKTSVAEKLSKFYKIHHINAKAIFDEKIQSLVRHSYNSLYVLKLLPVCSWKSLTYSIRDLTSFFCCCIFILTHPNP